MPWIAGKPVLEICSLFFLSVTKYCCPTANLSQKYHMEKILNIPPELYDYQARDIETIFEKIAAGPGSFPLLYQLPTGGGKTVVFSEIVRRFSTQSGKKSIVLTHRRELCSQTSKAIQKAGIKSSIIDSSVKIVRKSSAVQCYVAMVETLHNRLEDNKMNTGEIGLVIIDEAHHNSFQKLLDKFENAIVIGVTATPLSSNADFSMKKTYKELVLGEDIQSLIKGGFLAKPKIWEYEVELQTLQTGTYGDFTASTSDLLYCSKAMLDLLLSSYKEHSLGKKTLIFNNGILASQKACAHFNDAGIAARHLDHHATEPERREILAWFKKTKGAVLTSVSLLTTGFDEPSVQTVVLNRATTSLTLYHQMVGRGSRRLPSKKTFTVIDLGNNSARFGKWNEPVDWNEAFSNPEAFCQNLSQPHDDRAHAMPSSMRAQFPNSLEIAFDITDEHKKASDAGLKPQSVIRDSIRQHARMCVENAAGASEAIELSGSLEKEIAWRVREYASCLGKTTKNYRDWLESDYKLRLRTLIQKIYGRQLAKTPIAS